MSKAEFYKNVFSETVVNILDNIRETWYSLDVETRNNNKQKYLSWLQKNICKEFKDFSEAKSGKSLVFTIRCADCDVQLEI